MRPFAQRAWNTSRPATIVQSTRVAGEPILGAGERVAVDEDHVGELARLDRAFVPLLEVEPGVVDRVEAGAPRCA